MLWTLPRYLVCLWDSSSNKGGAMRNHSFYWEWPGLEITTLERHINLISLDTKLDGHGLDMCRGRAVDNVSHRAAEQEDKNRTEKVYGQSRSLPLLTFGTLGASIQLMYFFLLCLISTTIITAMSTVLVLFFCLIFNPLGSFLSLVGISSVLFFFTS